MQQKSKPRLALEDIIGYLFVFMFVIPVLPLFIFIILVKK
jgi:hypothetical protein